MKKEQRIINETECREVSAGVVAGGCVVEHDKVITTLPQTEHPLPQTTEWY